MASQATSPASMDYYSKGTNTATTSAVTSRDGSPSSSVSPASTPGGVTRPLNETSTSGTGTTLAPSGASVIARQSSKGPENNTKVRVVSSGGSSPMSPLSPSSSPSSSPASPVSPAPPKKKSRVASKPTTAVSQKRSNSSGTGGSVSGATGAAGAATRRGRSPADSSHGGSSDESEDDAGGGETTSPGPSVARTSRKGATSRATSNSSATSTVRSSSRGASSVAPSLASFATDKGPRVSKRRGKKQLKDKRVHLYSSGAPKKPPTSFGLFKHKLRKLKKGKVKFQEFNREAAKKWKNMSPEKKAPFEKRAKELMDHFAKVKQSYYRRKIKRLRQDLGPIVVSPSPKGRRVHHTDKRKRAARTNPFMLFTNEIRSKIREELGSEASVSQVAAEIGRRWKELPNDVKRDYIIRGRRAAKMADARVSRRLEKSRRNVKQQQQQQQQQEGSNASVEQ